MKKFDVEITETLQRTVSVEAASQEEAERMVTESWNNDDYVLDSKDFIDVDFKTVGEHELSENKEKLDVLLVQPGAYPQKISIGTDLKDLQDAVGGTITATYPFTDPVAIVCNDEGKLLGLPMNRALRDEHGQTYQAADTKHTKLTSQAGTTRATRFCGARHGRIFQTPTLNAPEAWSVSTTAATPSAALTSCLPSTWAWRLVKWRRKE